MCDQWQSFLCLILAVLLTAGCEKNTTEATECEPTSLRNCTCTDGEIGEETCAHDGSAWLECECVAADGDADADMDHDEEVECESNCHYPGHRVCRGTLIETCTEMEEGCLQWVTTQDCVDGDMLCIPGPPEVRCEAMCEATLHGDHEVSNETEAAELNWFATITGSVTIHDSNLVDLGNLGCLREVGGDLMIHSNNLLTSLDGLESLETVGGVLAIGSNPALESLQGLQSLSSLGESADDTARFVISGCASLVDLQGLEQIESVAELSISDNDSLLTLDGLTSLRSAVRLTIDGNDSLTSLMALSGLEQVEILDIGSNASLMNLEGLGGLDSFNGLQVFNNESLTDLSGLESVTTIEYYIMIMENPALESFAGLESVTYTYELWVSQNHSLTSLEGLDALESVDVLTLWENATLSSLDGLGSLTRIRETIEITDNLQLPTCEIDAFVAGLEEPLEPGAIGVWGNDDSATCE